MYVQEFVDESVGGEEERKDIIGGITAPEGVAMRIILVCGTEGGVIVL